MGRRNELGVGIDPRGHHYHFDGPAFERLSEVAAVGRSYVMGIPGIGSKRIAELDSVLERFGMAWNPNAHPLKRRPPRRSEPAPSSYDSRVRAVIDSLRQRLASLEARLLGQEQSSEDEAEAERVASDLERDGNLICFPGVTLARVRDRGDDPGPTAA